jgi:hypothetical protein
MWKLIFLWRRGTMDVNKFGNILGSIIFLFGFLVFGYGAFKYIDSGKKYSYFESTPQTMHILQEEAKTPLVGGAIIMVFGFALVASAKKKD